MEWSTSNASIATVSSKTDGTNGTVTFYKPGNVTIYANDEKGNQLSFGYYVLECQFPSGSAIYWDNTRTSGSAEVTYGTQPYAYFYIGTDYFYFEDDEESKNQAVLSMPGVWYQPELDEDGRETAEEQYFWQPSDLQVLTVDDKPVSLYNNGRA